jgi:pyrimidine operon attenuation protein / uracil phosphoribosyltransferase
LHDVDSKKVGGWIARTGSVGLTGDFNSKPGQPIFRTIMAAPQSTLLDARAIDRTLRRMADEILELNEGTDDLVIVGIQRRGVQLAARIVSNIADREQAKIPSGALDITLYRDDLQTVGPRPVVGPTEIPIDIEGKRVVIVDDVLYTGRTIRAALDELADFGRPKRIALAVLIDRGGRELPIQPDVVGKVVTVPAGHRVDVLVKELDDRDAVVLAATGGGT